MTKKVLLAAAFVAMLGGAAMAQGGLTFKLGGAFPMGDFADAKADFDNNTLRWGLDSKHDDGGAGLGFNLGIEYAAPVSSVNGLSVVLSLDGFYNGLNEELNDYFTDLKDYLDDNVDEWSLTTPSYLNFPAMVGAKYEMPLTSGINFYGAAAVGANLRIITPFKVSYEVPYTGTVTAERTTTSKYDAAVSFAFRLAAGVTFAEKYVFELGYYSLGAGKVKGKEFTDIEYSSSNYTDVHNDDKFTLKSVAPTFFTARVGIKF